MEVRRPSVPPKRRLGSRAEGIPTPPPLKVLFVFLLYGLDEALAWNLPVSERAYFRDGGNTPL